MRLLKGLIAGALALGSLMMMPGAASARQMTPPTLTPVVSTESGQGATTQPSQSCDRVWGNRRQWRDGRAWRGPRWHHPRYGYYRPHYYRPVYGYHRPWGYGPRRHWNRW